MKVYSVTELSNSCMGVYSSLDKATEAAFEFIQNNGYQEVEETVWTGFKSIYYQDNNGIGYCIEIWSHNIDNSVS